MSETLEQPAAVEETGPTPEEALAEVRQQLADSQAAADASARRAAVAEANVRQAGGAVQTAHQVALDSRVAAEEARLTNARSALRAAREAGDVDAEGAAFEEISSARPLLDALKQEKARIASAPKQQQQPEQVPLPQATQQWFVDHPRYERDRYYKATAEAAHFEAIDQGITEASPAYFNHINRVLAEKYGDNHGTVEAMTRPAAQPAKSGAKVPASSFATPPGRGNATNAKGGHNLNEIASKIGVTAEVAREHATINYPHLSEDEAVKRWCAAQGEILAERNPSVITYGDGAVFR